MSLKNRSKAYYFATICTLASVLGGIAGYYIGVFAMEQVGPLLANLGYESKLESAQIYFNTYGIVIILVLDLVQSHTNYLLFQLE